MGQMGPVLVSVSFTLNSVIKRVTKPPSVNPVRGCVILTQWLVHQRAVVLYKLSRESESWVPPRLPRSSSSPTEYNGKGSGVAERPPLDCVRT